MRFLLLCTTILTVVAIAGAACGGDNADQPTPVPTSAPFDPNVLSGMVLDPQDVPELAPRVGVFAPGADNVVSFTSSYGDDVSFYLQSTVGHYGDISKREQSIEQVRRGLVFAMRNERNLNLAAADRAYVYRYLEGTPAAAVLAIRGDFWVLVQMISRDGSREADVFDDARLQSYVALSLERVQRYIDDPSAVQPAPWAVHFESPTPASEAPTPPAP